MWSKAYRFNTIARIFESTNAPNAFELICTTLKTSKVAKTSAYVYIQIRQQTNYVTGRIKANKKAYQVLVKDVGSMGTI